MSLMSDEELAEQDFEEAIYGQIGVQLPDFIFSEQQIAQEIGDHAAVVAGKLNEVDVCAIGLLDYELPESGAYEDYCEEFEDMVQDEEEVKKFLMFLYQEIDEISRIISRLHLEIEDYDVGRTKTLDIGAPGDDNEEDWMTVKLYFEFW